MTGGRLRIRYRLAYSKDGPLRFVSHRDMIQVLTRALRRAGAPLSYTQGFSPRPRFSLAPPLPLGVRGRRELMDLELDNHIDERDFLDMLNLSLPDGLFFTNAVKLMNGAPGLNELLSRCEYFFEPKGAMPGECRIEELTASAELTISKVRKKDGKTRTVDVRPLLHSLESRDGAVHAVVTAAPRTISPFDLAPLIWPGLEAHPLEVLDILRIGFLTEDGRAICRRAMVRPPWEQVGRNDGGRE